VIFVKHLLRRYRYNAIKNIRHALFGLTSNTEQKHMCKAMAIHTCSLHYTNAIEARKCNSKIYLLFLWQCSSVSLYYIHAPFGASSCLQVCIQVHCVCIITSHAFTKHHYILHFPLLYTHFLTHTNTKPCIALLLHYVNV